MHSILIFNTRGYLGNHSIGNFIVLHSLILVIFLLSFQCFAMDCGLSLCDPRIFPDLVSKCKDLEINTVYYQVPWNSIEPVIGEARDWGYWDDFITKLQKAGINQVPLLAQKEDFYTPKLPDGQIATCDNCDIGAYSSNHIKDFLSRYKGIFTHVSIMGEMNEIRLRKLFGWITGTNWDSLEYVTEVLKKESAAIKEVDPDIKVIVPFHTDIHEDIHHDDDDSFIGISPQYLAGPYSWIEIADMWKDYYDILGIDAYPNYYVASPLYSGDIQNRVLLASSIGKPVWVCETNYPYTLSECPELFNYTYQKQKDYIYDLVWGARNAGAERFYLFDSGYAEGLKNIYTQEDVDNMMLISDYFRYGKGQELIKFAFSHLSYCTNRLSVVLDNHREGMSIMGKSKTEGWYGFYNAIHGLPKDNILLNLHITDFFYVPGIIVGYEGYGWIWENGTYNYGKITGNKVIYVKGMNQNIKYIPQPQPDFTLQEGWNAIGYWGPELPIHEVFPDMVVYHYKNGWNRYTPLEYLNNLIVCQKANVYFVYKGKF